jgi:hypothetical protein
MTEGSMDTVFTRLDAAPARSPKAGALPAFSRWLKACLARSRQRRDLGLLSEDELRTSASPPPTSTGNAGERWRQAIVSAMT